MTDPITHNRPRATFFSRVCRDLAKNYILYIMILPVVAYYVIFAYIPMGGIMLAFKDYQIKQGIFGSAFVGFKHFSRFLGAYNLKQLVLNTVSISLYCIILGTVAPIAFSLLINYVRNKHWKKTLQMVTYLPYFISTVVLVGMLNIFFGDNGLVNSLLKNLGLTDIPFMSSAEMFRPMYTLSSVWQGLGFSSVVYIAALAGVDQQIHEAAIVDGAKIRHRMWYIDLMEIRPTIMVLFIMSLGGIINVGYEKVLLMQNALNTATSEVLSTYVYKVGLINSDYGFSTAIGVVNSLVSMILLISANLVAKRIAGYSVW